jgi:putative ABC transport system permease protein
VIPRLYLKSVRDLWRIRRRALLIALVIALSLSLSAGILYAGETLAETTGTVYERANMADYELHGSFTDADVARLESTAYVESVTARATRRGVVDADGTEVFVTIYTYDSSDPVNRPIVLDGRGSLDAGEVLVDTRLRDFHGYDVGDRLEVNYEGATREYDVEGVAVSASHVVVSPGPAVVVPLPEAAAVVFVEEGSATPADSARRYDYLAVRTTPGEYETDLEASFPASVVVPRADQYSYSYLESEVQQFRDLTFPFFFTLMVISLVMIYTTMTKVVRSQQVEIGILSALGYPKSRIALSFLLILVVVSVAGAVLGAAGGVLVGRALADAYVDIVGLPFVVPADPVPYVAAALAAGVTVPLLAAVPPLRTVLALRPREAFSQRTLEPFSGRPLIERALARVVPVPILVRYGIRNLTRRRLRTVLTVLGIALAVGSAAIWIFPMDSFTPVFEEEMAKNEWDISAETVRPLTDVSEITAIPGVRAAELYSSESFTFPDRKSETGEAYLLFGVEPDSRMVDPSFTAGRMATRPGEIALSNNLATREHLQTGDRISIVVGGEERTYTVVGVYSSMSQDAYTVRRGPTNLVYIETDDQARAIDEVLASPLVRTAMNFDRVATGYEALVEDSSSIIYFGALMGAAVAVLFTFSTITLEIVERRREYNVIRMLGYRRLELLSSIAAETLIIGVFATVPGILMGVVGGWLLFDYAARMNDIYGIQMAVEPSKLLLVFLVVMSALSLVVLPAYRRLTAMDITDVSRREAG